MLLIYALNSCAHLFIPHSAKHERRQGQSLFSRRRPPGCHFKPGQALPRERVLKRSELQEAECPSFNHCLRPPAWLPRPSPPAAVLETGLSGRRPHCAWECSMNVTVPTPLVELASLSRIVSRAGIIGSLAIARGLGVLGSGAVGFSLSSAVDDCDLEQSTYSVRPQFPHL